MLESLEANREILFISRMRRTVVLIDCHVTFDVFESRILDVSMEVSLLMKFETMSTCAHLPA